MLSQLNLEKQELTIQRKREGSGQRGQQNQSQGGGEKMQCIHFSIARVRNSRDETRVHKGWVMEALTCHVQVVWTISNGEPV